MYVQACAYMNRFILTLNRRWQLLHTTLGLFLQFYEDYSASYRCYLLLVTSSRNNCQVPHVVPTRTAVRFQQLSL